MLKPNRARSIIGAGSLVCIAAAMSSCCSGHLASAPDLTIYDDPMHCPETVLITFSVDGGPEQETDCELTFRQSGECFCDITLAAETEGTFIIFVRTQDGEREGATTVEVEADSCHVEPTEATIRL